MTREEKDRVIQLRASGEGCKHIAELLGVSINTVKSFCKRNGLTALQASNLSVSDVAGIAANPAIYKTDNRNALVDSQPATAPPPVDSMNCPTDASACQQCGIHIDQIPGRKQKRFCSTACRMKWWREHQEAMNRKAAHSATCAECGAVFVYYGSTERKYCSRSCYMEHRFNKKGVIRHE